MPSPIDPATKADAIVYYLMNPGVSQIQAASHYTHKLTRSFTTWYSDFNVKRLVMERLGCTEAVLDELYRKRRDENIQRAGDFYRAPMR